MAETKVRLTRPAKPSQKKGKKLGVPGIPVEARLVVSRVLGADGEVLAEWLLLSNVNGIPSGDNRPVVLLALANRILFQADEVDRASSGIVAAEIGFNHRQTLIGCQYGVCHGMGNSSK